MKYATALLALLTIVACGLDVKNATGRDSSGPVIGPTGGGPSTTPAPGSAPSAGETAYLSKCASCHSLGTFDTTTSAGAPNLKGKSSGVADRYPTPGTSGHQGIILSAAEISALTTFIASK